MRATSPAPNLAGVAITLALAWASAATGAASSVEDPQSSSDPQGSAVRGARAARAATTQQPPSPPPTPSPPALPVGQPEPIAPKPPFVRVGDRGFSLESGDGSFVLRLRTLFQVDGRFYGSEQGEREGLETVDDLLVRRGRLELTGTLFEQFDFRIMPDFAPENPNLLDAWLRWRLKPALQIQVGKVKLPVGLEREQTREFNLFNEFGYPTSLVPNRDTGLNVQGQVLDGGLSYYAGIYNGASDGASPTNDTNDGKTAAARLFATPTAGRWKGLGIGIAATHGRQEGPPSPYRTVGQQIFHEWRPEVTTDGEVSRVAGQLYWFRGRFGGIGEWVAASHEVSAPGARAELENTAWLATVSWVLTGEENTFRGVRPRHNVDPRKGEWGAWQLLARVTELDVDDDAFPIFADPVRSSSRARSYGVGINWYLNPQIRVSADYHLTELEGGDLDDEDAITGRVQFRF
jgi:phosphate-selective porin OprO/OprP